MTTQKQVEANRRNAERSTGPKTEAGKEQSRRNAITHGLTSTVALADTVEAMIVERIAAFSVAFPPSSELDHWYVEQLAVESVRIEQAQSEEQSLMGGQAHRAEVCWDDERFLEAEWLLDKLPKKPAKFKREIEQTKQGCELMFRRWQSLQSVLEQTGKPWGPVHRGMALDLLGVDPAFREVSYAEVTTVELQCELARREMMRLGKQRVERLNAIDCADRERASRGTAFPDRTIWRVRRYEAASHRNFERALKYLTANAQKKAEPKTPNTLFVIEPKPVNPLEKTSEDLEEVMADLREKEVMLEPVASAPKNVEPFEAAIATSEKPKGNAEYRKKRSHQERKAARAAQKLQRVM